MNVEQLLDKIHAAAEALAGTDAVVIITADTCEYLRSLGWPVSISIYGPAYPRAIESARNVINGVRFEVTAGRPASSGEVMQLQLAGGSWLDLGTVDPVKK